MKNEERTIIAIEVRRSCVGYAVFEKSKLLDWGATTPYPLDGIIRRAKKRLLFLLTMLHPALIVIKVPCKSASGGPILSLLKMQAAEGTVPVLNLAQGDIRKVFSPFGVRNKYQAAEALTGIFPDLFFKLPTKRKTGDSERHRMIIFDAVATGYAYLQTRSTSSPPS